MPVHRHDLNDTLRLCSNLVTIRQSYRQLRKLTQPMTLQTQQPIEEKPIDTPLANAPCFIETQFPVAKVSMESYKERKADTAKR